MNILKKNFIISFFVVFVAIAHTIPLQADDEEEQPPKFSPCLRPAILFDQSRVFHNKSYAYALAQEGFFIEGVNMDGTPLIQVDPKIDSEALDHAFEREFIKQWQLMCAKELVCNSVIPFAIPPCVIYAVYRGVKTLMTSETFSNALATATNSSNNNIQRPSATNPQKKMNEWTIFEAIQEGTARGLALGASIGTDDFNPKKFFTDKPSRISFDKLPVFAKNAGSMASSLLTVKNDKGQDEFSFKGLATSVGGLGAASIVTTIGSLFYAKQLTKYYTTGLNAFSMMCSPTREPLYVYCRQYAINKRLLNFLDNSEDQRLYSEYGRIPYIEEAFISGNTNVIKSFLSVPTKSKRPDFDMDEAYRCFDLYSQQAQQILMRTCVNHIESYQSTIGINSKSREFLNLVSPPGVGKTMLARTMARLIGVPVETVCLADGTIEKIFGSSENPGWILEAMGRLGSRNGILFFDELDRVTDDRKLLSVLLPFLEPSEKKFYSPYLQRTIDVSHLLIIVAGNFSFKDPALLSRFHALKTVPLNIVNPSRLGKIVTEDYLYSKLLPYERELLSNNLKEQWAQQVSQYVSD